MDLKEIGWGHRLDLSGSGETKVAICCEGDEKRSGFMECGEFLDWLKYY